MELGFSGAMEADHLQIENGKICIAIQMTIFKEQTQAGILPLEGFISSNNRRLQHVNFVLTGDKIYM